MTESILSYCSTMMLVRALHSQGLISLEEYVQIDELFRKKYSLPNGTLYQDIALLLLRIRGNMPR